MRQIWHAPPSRAAQMLAGKRAISADTAVRLGRCFGTDLST